MGQRLASAVNDGDLTRQGNTRAKSKAQNEFELKLIIGDVRKLLARLEDAVPLINLAITTSGASLSTALPSTISPSRLLQASTFLTAGDTQYSFSSSQSEQIGPSFTLSMYMLFSGHLRPLTEAEMQDSTWKEVIHKAHVKLMRVPIDAIYGLPLVKTAPSPLRTNKSSGGRFEADTRADEFAYQLLIIEDLEDDRVHTFEENEEQPGRFDDVEIAGIREALPIHEISKIFYADTGKILNIGNEGEINNPVLLLKRDVNAIPPRRMMERFSEDIEQDYTDDGYSRLNGKNVSEDNDISQSEIDAQIDREHRSSSLAPATEADLVESTTRSNPWRIPLNLDPEWIAFEVYPEEEESDEEPEAEPARTEYTKSSRASSLDFQMTSALSQLNITDSSFPPNGGAQQLVPQSQALITVPRSSVPPIRTSLSLLETLLRLLSLQQFQQTSHLAIPDELLNFFLSESATTGAANGDDQERRRLRSNARRRVGFDPYDESPIKRHGEDYQYQSGTSQMGEDQIYRQDAESPRSGTYHRYDRYQSPGYESPRYDEGYDTHRFYQSPRPYAHAHAQESPVETSPLLLKHRSQSSRGGTPERSTSPLIRSSSSGPSFASPSPSRRKGRPDVLKSDDNGRTAAKKGSPLARLETGMTDEGQAIGPGP